MVRVCYLIPHRLNKVKVKIKIKKIIQLPKILKLESEVSTHVNDNLTI